ncbi:Hypothetical protein NGAL_HAMBI2427_43200 [Neorhizobium galegae bv. orientalis]|uniref:Uncharacterized protein n=2 Tax=Neorhizobium galegae TaxID=399 RepID=A0A068T1B9_NEOGA|nr:Hypothetical protein RG540_PA11650 [Neorhizobium galegae bv. orientalis str. HAMBI 540]CDZ51763.1 Hypothetical protein NGAL_HAMBI2427_43200 [Neorhizobium galegae bv. orientalis]
MVRWVQVKTPHGVRKALTFWASTKRVGLTMPLSQETTATLIANACGEGGSCAQYSRRQRAGKIAFTAKLCPTDRHFWSFIGRADHYSAYKMIWAIPSSRWSVGSQM